MPTMPLNLARRGGLAYGLQLPPELVAAAQQAKVEPAQATPAPGAGRGYAVSEALAATPRVQGNSIVEALGAALQGGLAGREQRREHQRELDAQQREIDQQTRTQKQADGREASITDALTAYQSADPNDPQAQLSALVGALSRGDPQDAMPLIQSDVSGRLGQNRERGQYEWQRNYDNEHPAAITPAQQAQFDTTRRGQDLDYQASLNRANGGGGMMRLRGPDASQLTRVQQAGESARQLEQLANQFEGANQHTGTGPIGQWTQYFGGDMAAMRQASSLMRGMMRPVGSGATSDYEQRLYMQGAPDPGLPGPANQERINNIRHLAAITNARQFFYEEYADQNGTLRGAEQAFQASDDFRRVTAPPSAAPAGGGAATPTPEEARAELARRRGAQ